MLVARKIVHWRPLPHRKPALLSNGGECLLRPFGRIVGCARHASGSATAEGSESTEITWWSFKTLLTCRGKYLTVMSRAFPPSKNVSNIHIEVYSSKHILANEALPRPPRCQLISCQTSHRYRNKGTVNCPN